MRYGDHKWRYHRAYHSLKLYLYYITSDVTKPVPIVLTTGGNASVQ